MAVWLLPSKAREDQVVREGFETIDAGEAPNVDDTAVLVDALTTEAGLADEAAQERQPVGVATP